MHHPDLLESPYYDQEAAQKIHHDDFSQAVAATIANLSRDVQTQVTEQELKRVLKYLGLRDKPFLGSPDFYNRRMVLDAAYRLVYEVYWYQMIRHFGFKGKAMKAFSGIFQFGVGPIVHRENSSLNFSVFAKPACPVLSAYRGDLGICRQSCLERSRHGVFTNPVISRALSYYHGGLKLKLEQFRGETSKPCLYKIVLENH